MICSECIYKNNCMYEPLEEWEEGCFYPPCVHISDKHADYIRENNFKVVNSIDDTIASIVQPPFKFEESGCIDDNSEK